MLRAASLAVVLALSACAADACRPSDPDAGPEPEEDAGAPPPDPFHDPLARPEEPTLFVGNFTPARTCGGCHTTHHDQWRTSMHSYATKDPVWRALVRARQAEFDGAQDQYCVQCHTPIGTRGGEIEDGFSFDDLSLVARDGVSCETCHKMSAVARPYNAGLVLDEFGPMRGTIEQPVESQFHASTYDPLFKSSSLCGSCHDVLELNGLSLERPYAEWLESPAREERVTCQQCHMPTYRGRATFSAPERVLHDHRFVGVDVPFADDFFDSEAERADHIARVGALLDDAASLDVASAEQTVPGGELNVHVTVTNEIQAHAFPTGTTFIRQVWVELIAEDATGRVLYETGTLDDNGDLRDAFSELDPYGDNDLVSFSSTLVDETGGPIILPWRATEHVTRSLSPGKDRTRTLFVPIPADAVGPVRVRARLLFRSHGPYLLRTLGLEDEVDELLLWELDAAEASVAVVTP